MVQKLTSYALIHRVLANDIYSSSGTLLLSKGKELQASDITLLMNHGIFETDVAHTFISKKVLEQYNDLWTYNDYQLKDLRDSYLDSLERIKELFQEVLSGEISPLSEFMLTFTPIFEKTLNYSYLFHPLHKIKGHDEYTYRHSLNVGLLSGVIGKILGLPAHETFLLGQMGLLHDIGKVKIKDNVLNKPGKLSNEEFDQIKSHTYFGFELLNKMEGTNEDIYNGALSHHERLDGSGYPQGLKGDEISFLTQILSVADTYDAICSDRIYQHKSSPYYAAQELMDGVYQGRYSSKIVIPFVRYLAEGYIGDQAILDNGQVGEVILIHPEEPHRPTLKIEGEYIDLRTHRSLKIIDLKIV
jgi:HD-GYP domain-containing protein (c-di-GMP phosphodiesterase class II)